MKAHTSNKWKQFALTLFIFCVVFLSYSEIVFAEDIKLKSGQDINEVVENAKDKDRIFIENGETYTLKDVKKEGIDIIVNNGHLNFENAEITNTNGLMIYGDKASATINGGKIVTKQMPLYCDGIYLNDGGSIDTIENVTIDGYHSAIKLERGSKIGEIKSGNFKNGMADSRGPIGAVINVLNSRIDKISDGEFTSVHDSAIHVGNGSHIGTIEGGKFLAKQEFNAYPNYNVYDWNYSSAIVLYVHHVSSFPNEGASIGKITGGDFQGTHAIYMLSGREGQSTNIGEISGGNFRNIETVEGKNLSRQTVFTSQRSQIGEISGGRFEASNADVIHMTFNANEDNREPSSIDRITGGNFFATGEGRAIFLNDPRYSIGEIADGNFIAGKESTYE